VFLPKYVLNPHPLRLRSNAEMAKETMSNQALEKEEILNIR
jgi:hypothetical protein